MERYRRNTKLLELAVGN